MRSIKTRLLVGLFAAVVAILNGCDTEPSNQIAIHISPNNAQVKVHESQEFFATGFTDYTWTLSDTKIGVLSTTKGGHTVYTAVTSASNIVQVLTVTARLSLDTNGAPITVSSEALITHY